MINIADDGNSSARRTRAEICAIAREAKVSNPRARAFAYAARGTAEWIGDALNQLSPQGVQAIAAGLQANHYWEGEDTGLPDHARRLDAAGRLFDRLLGKAIQPIISKRITETTDLNKLSGEDVRTLERMRAKLLDNPEQSLNTDLVSDANAGTAPTVSNKYADLDDVPDKSK